MTDTELIVWQARKIAELESEFKRINDTNESLLSLLNEKNQEIMSLKVKKDDA